MVALPAATPVITPVNMSMPAIAGAELLHVPSGVILLRLVVRPSHTSIAPTIGSGNGFTVTVTEFRQPVGNVYRIFAVPIVLPVTIPVASIPATSILSLPHVPPPVVLTRL